MIKRFSYNHARAINTKFVFERVRPFRHALLMRTVEEIRAALRSLKGTGLTQAKVGDLVGLHQTRVSEIALGKRELGYDEGIALCRVLWPEDAEFSGVSPAEVERMKADWLASVAFVLPPLLELLGVEEPQRTAGLRAALAALRTIQEHPEDASVLPVQARAAIQALWSDARLPERTQ